MAEDYPYTYWVWVCPDWDWFHFARPAGKVHTDCFSKQIQKSNNIPQKEQSFYLPKNFRKKLLGRP
jgi:hypothetical protein